jgi:hypothetical protein
MEPVFLFIYAKNDRIKVLSLNDAKIQHDGLINNGMKHVSTIDAIRFLENFDQENELCFKNKNNYEIWFSPFSSVFNLEFKNYDRNSQFFLFLEISSSKYQFVFWK